MLLIACANVANLLLAKAGSRRQEMALRTALGAGRSRVVRQLLTENVLMALMGAGLGVALSRFCLKLILSLNPGYLPELLSVELELRVLLFTLGVAVATGLLFGLVPALHVSGKGLSRSLRESGARQNLGPGRRRLTSALVVAETALSLVLLIGAGLLIRTFVELRNVEPGFRADNVLTLELALRGTRYDETAELDAFVTRAFERIEALSGVEAAASVTRLPMEGGMWIPFEIDARPEGAHDRNGEGLWRAITPRYFDVMEIPLSRGRPFDRRDGVLAPPVAIINEALARKFWPDREPIGERINRGAVDGSGIRGSLP